MQVGHRARRESEADVRPGAILEREDYHVLVDRGRSCRGTTDTGRFTGSAGAGFTGTARSARAARPAGAARPAVSRARGTRFAVIAAIVPAKVLHLEGLLTDIAGFGVGRARGTGGNQDARQQ